MKIVLIHPNGNKSLKVPPLGLAYITSLLKKNNIETRIIDLNVEKVSLNKYLVNEKPKIIGISSILTNASQALKIAEQTKKVLPDSYVVMGGPYPSLMGTLLVAKHSDVDAILVGEGEFTFLELVNRLKNGKRIDAIEGVIFREKNRIKSNLPPNPIYPIDKIPYPAREELKMQLYDENKGTIFTSRGCPNQCTFCSRPIFGRNWRGHSPDYVIKEIRQLIDKYQISLLSILDDNFAFDLNRTEKILDGIIAKKWEIDIYFWNGLRADQMTKTLAVKLKKAGCSTINFGVESIDPNVLSVIKKGVTLNQIKKTIKITKQVGIKTNLFLMIGNPNDTSKTADKIIAFVKKMQVNGVHLSMATPILGTDFWNWVEKNGYWLNYDKEELLDWPVDDVAGTFPVFETIDFTAKERIQAYNKIRNFLEENELII
ncbi:B12-binding domain-containing radical SAM protein [Candidatus Bathyarchaeota archaeon]|nr:B12-binding domain-containing radical SAM protein [Candidatus Bathyarchaeota archaeon]